MNENSVMTLDNLQVEAMSLDELEANLSNELEEQLSGLEFLEKERQKIGNPEGLGATIENAVWEQFRLQIGSIAGEDFMKSNNNLTLDLSNEAHTQNIEDFKKGIFNLRNSETYKQRYEDYKENFVLDEQGQIKYFSEGRQKGKPIFKRERRVELFDKGRTKGKDGNDMDHSVPASKMIRDAEAYANLPQEEIVKFANSDQNLNEIPSSLNSAKNDRSIKELIASYEQKGIDISGSRGQSVKAAASGRVVYAGNALRGYGNLIIIKHNDDFLSAYAHNDKILVTDQQEVKAGQEIAKMGSSGTNTVKLHFEIRYKGKSVDPIRYLPRR